MTVNAHARIHQLPGNQSGTILAPYFLQDTAPSVNSITVEFAKVNGPFANIWFPATQGLGGDGLVGLSADTYPGDLHTFAWDSVADGAGLQPPQYYKLRIAVSGAQTREGPPFLVNNQVAPQIVNITPPPPNPVGNDTGLLTISYDLVDANNDVCNLVFEYDIGAGFVPCTAGPGGDGVQFIQGSPGGTPHTFVWNIGTDLGVGQFSVLNIRITATDIGGGIGVGLSGPFDLDTRPQAPTVANVLPVPPAQTVFPGPEIEFTFDVFDLNSDLIDVTAEWSGDGVNWSPATPAALSPSLLGLASSPGGTPHSFIWDTLADNVRGRPVMLRLTPED